MKLLTVAEYAELHDITTQAVYKKINRLKTITQERNGKTVTMIVIEDSEDNNSAPISKEDNPETATPTPNNQPNATNDNPETEEEPTDKTNSEDATTTPSYQPTATDTNIIEMLKEIIAEKDKQIAKLQDTTDKLTQLLSRSQELEAMTHKLLLGQGEIKTADNGSIEVVETEQTTEGQTTAQPKQKKKLFQWLFG